MKRNRLILPVLVMMCISLTLTACNFPLFGSSASTPTVQAQDVQTIVAQTLSAALSQTPAVTGTTAATLTPAASMTPQATLTPANTSTPVYTPTPQCLSAAFETDVTVPDNTQYFPGETFTKTWRLRNTGSCTWTTGFKIVFDSGVQMGGPASVNLPAVIAPGQTVDVSVNLTAPKTGGVQTGNWKLQSDTGTKFGIGATNGAFYVQIDVRFAVTDVVMSAERTHIESACPANATFRFSAEVKANRAGTATVHWIRSDGGTTSAQTLTFSAAGSQTVTTSWLIGAAYSGWVSIYVDDPNHQEFPRINFDLVCTP